MQGVKIVAAMCVVRNSVGENSYVADEIITSRAGVRLRSAPFSLSSWTKAETVLIRDADPDPELLVGSGSEINF